LFHVAQSRTRTFFSTPIKVCRLVHSHCSRALYGYSQCLSLPGSHRPAPLSNPSDRGPQPEENALEAVSCWFLQSDTVHNPTDCNRVRFRPLLVGDRDSRTRNRVERAVDPDETAECSNRPTHVEKETTQVLARTLRYYQQQQNTYIILRILRCRSLTFLKPKLSTRLKSTS